MSMLRGSFPGIALSDLLQLLHANKNSGELQVTQGLDQGVLFLQLGTVVHAQIAKAEGELAAFAILAWDQGEFEFHTTLVQSVRTISRSLPDLVMEAARIADSRSHLLDIFPDPSLVPWASLPVAKLARNLKLSDEAQQVLTFMDGYRTLGEIIAASGQTDVSVLQVCTTLQHAGWLVPLRPTISVAAVPAMDVALDGPWLLSKAHEVRWMAMGPYGARPIEHVRLLLTTGTLVVSVRFLRQMNDQEVGVPAAILQSQQISKGTWISIRPDPLLASNNSLTLIPLG